MSTRRKSMTKVLYYGKEIELIDELESGYMELDLLTEEIERKLEDTIELEPINLQDTIELNLDSLEDTHEMKLGDFHE